jgi:protocatechuate 3,4-dioxygenase beta subunit
MHALTRKAIFITVTLSATLCIMTHAAARQQKSANPTGSITGRVTIGNKPVPNIIVMFMPSEWYPGSNREMEKTVTDNEGRFQLTRIPAGSYRVLTFAPAYFSEGDGQDYRRDKIITLADGENIEGINLTLKRGGVITGRITDARGRPLVQQKVSLSILDEQGRAQDYNPGNYRMMQTDDRGIYRIYGLLPGRYTLSTGVPPNQGHTQMESGTSYYPLTFHPGVTDESKAIAVEITQGSEATGIDIVMGRTEKAYTMSGRVVDADTGKPVANQNCGYGYIYSAGNYLSSSVSGSQSDDKGEFRIEGIVPGKYVALVIFEEGSERYTDHTPFEITDRDIKGVEIKVHRGASISGTLVIEGANEQETALKLSEIGLSASVLSRLSGSDIFSGVKINSDGSFRITGVRPGKVRITLNYPYPKGISLLRVERDGVEQREGIEVAADESVSAVKVVLVYGTGVIRGQLKIEGAVLPGRIQLIALYRRADDSSAPIQKYAETDERGRFVIEGLAPGEYEIRLSSESFPMPNGPPLLLKVTKQAVFVTNGAETEITLVLELESKNN